MPEQTLLQIGIDQLFPDPGQPRKSFLKAELEALADSIKARGMLLPLRVLHDPDRQAYRLICGESRWRAAKLAGLTQVPCIPVEGEVSETDILSDQIVENTVRNSLLPMELGRAIAKLKRLKSCTAQQLAAELGISGATISRCEMLLSLPESIQGMVDAGLIAPATAYDIARLPTPESQIDMAEKVAARRLSRDRVAAEVRSVVGSRQRTPKEGRLSVKLDGGISVTVSAGVPLKDALPKIIEHLKQEVKKLIQVPKPADLAGSVPLS